MKKKLLLIAFTFSYLMVFSQCIIREALTTTATMEVTTLSNGTIFAKENGSHPITITPNGNANESFFGGPYTAGLWLGGLDPAGNLKLSASEYFQNGQDFTNGLLDFQTGLSLYQNCEFNYIWKITRSEIELFIADYDDNNQIDNEVPDDIKYWPGRQNPNFSEKYNVELPENGLAKFYDRNEDGIYNIADGDVPLHTATTSLLSSIILPSEFLWFSSHDDIPHSNTSGASLQVEIHTSIFSFDCASNSDVIGSTIFTEHTIYNRAFEDLRNFRFGFWSDPDLGCYTNDFVGCLPTLNTAYVYDTGGNDGIGCQTAIPNNNAQAIVSHTFLDRSLDGFLSYNSGIGLPAPPATQAPTSPIEYYNFLNNTWRDGTPITFGGNGYNPGSTDVRAFTFSDLPTDPEGWSMESLDFAPSDYRMLMTSSLENTIPPGSSYTITMAHTAHIPETPIGLAIFNTFEDDINRIQAFHDSGFTTPCDAVSSSQDINSIADQINIFPNPSNGKISLETTDDNLIQIEVYNASGLLLENSFLGNSRAIDLDYNHLPTGMYILKISTEESKEAYKKLIITK